MSTPNPLPPAPADDVDLDALFQAAVAGITGLDGTLVRPRWQPVVPKQPEPTVNWCAIGVMSDTADASPWIASQGPAPGNVIYFRHERLEVLASFYGPKGKTTAKVLRDGIWIPQNMEGLQANSIALVDTGAIRAVPDIVNQQWIRRYDLPLSFNRKVVRVYPIETFEFSDIHLFDDTFLNDIIPVPPGSP